jgi:hypothetical protein
MKLKAKDTLHVSSVKADNLVPGEEFEVPDDVGHQFVERGLAIRVGVYTRNEVAAIQKAADEQTVAKAEPGAPANKMEPAPANKAPVSRKRKGK